MSATSWIRTHAGATQVTIDALDGARGTYVCAHGAGGSMDDRAMRAASGAMQAAGLSVVRFNFPYRERGSGRPDPMPLLTETVAAAAAFARAELAPRRLILGGRSMGGRAASMLASEGFACDGLVLLAYPLHPPRQPDKLRVAHLSRIAVPVLAISGTRDEFCTRELMERSIEPLGVRWTMHWLEGADHGFHVLKRSGRSDGDVRAEVTRTTARWLDNLDEPHDH